MSYGQTQKAVARLREEIEALVTQAYQHVAGKEAALGAAGWGMSCPLSWPVVKERLVQIEGSDETLGDAGQGSRAGRATAPSLSQRRSALRTGNPRRGKAPSTGERENRHQGPE